MSERRYARRPRVTATDGFEAIDIGTVDRGIRMTSPEITVEVSFDLGDHEHALRLLDQAIASVKEQVADAAEGSSG